MKVGAYMQQVLSSKELYTHLNNLREVLSDFDYSDIKNVRFINLQAVYSYIENVPDNPFKRQYFELQEILDTLQPYLPFVSSERAKSFLIDISNADNDEDIENLKKEYTYKLRLDFLNTARTITNDKEWKNIIGICEDIRSRKEEMYVH